MIKIKSSLRPNRVESDKFHVGIELELKARVDNESFHDDGACRDNQWDYINNLSDNEIIRDYMGLEITSPQIRRISPYFDSDKWREEYMEEWSCDGGCGYESFDGDTVRSDIETILTGITSNKSFKVVPDTSINCDSNEVDSEVCWNYFASKETIKDNISICKKLSDMGAQFDTSCGLHININNYLNVPEVPLDRSQLEFLFNVVAPSRRKSSYCTSTGVGINSNKYSMIYHQRDRLEFRFFSPTLDGNKLNHYVTLAHHIYKRLAGKDCLLPKRTTKYLRSKMIKTNKLDASVADITLSLINAIKPLAIAEKVGA